MKISELMTTKVACCQPQQNLAEIAAMLWKHDCGFLPVVDDKQHLIGILTDRDVCIALGTRNRRASEVSVEEAMSRSVFSCAPDDDVKTALATMRMHMVWRLPVVSVDRTVRGIITVGSVVRHASPTGEISHALVMSVLEELSASRREGAATATTAPEPLAAPARVNAAPLRTR